MTGAVALAIRYWHFIALAALCIALAGQQMRVSLAHGELAKERQERAEETAGRERAAREVEAANNRTTLARFNQAQEAINAARTRETTLRADADRASSELVRLRNAITIVARRSDVPRDPVSASPDPAIALGELLGACAAEAVELARIADRHASDARTLIEAWPER